MKRLSLFLRIVRKAKVQTAHDFPPFTASQDPCLRTPDACYRPRVSCPRRRNATLAPLVRTKYDHWGTSLRRFGTEGEKGLALPVHTRYKTTINAVLAHRSSSFQPSVLSALDSTGIRAEPPSFNKFVPEERSVGGFRRHYRQRCSGDPATPGMGVLIVTSGEKTYVKL